MSDKIHRILGGIYLSSIEPINEKINLKNDFQIDSVVSVVQGPIPRHIIQNYQHLHIDITDEETTNILEFLPQAMSFIDRALFQASNPSENDKKHSGAVLVHCVQGQSRSVTVVLAYLMYKYKLSLKQALYAVKRKVHGVEPNPGFLEQLGIFKDMGCTVDKSSKAYRNFIIANSLKLDPSGGSLREQGLWQNKGKVVNENMGDCASSADFHLRCKRCRTILATEVDIEKHEAPDSESREAQFIKTAPNSRRIVSAVEASKTCSHYFLDEPMSWMGQELEKQDIEGKFACPKCDAKVGGYSWRGSRCSCGKWMIPALHLQSAKVDSMKVN